MNLSIQLWTTLQSTTVTPRKSSSLIFISYSYPSIFNTLNTLSNLKRFPIFKVYDVWVCFRFFLRRHMTCQEFFCLNGSKKPEKANGLGNSWYTSYGTLNIMKLNLNKFGEKLNLIYLNLNHRVSYRCYSTPDFSIVNRISCNIQD
jgi:hypothetical protein